MVIQHVRGRTGVHVQVQRQSILKLVLEMLVVLNQAGVRLSEQTRLRCRPQ